jgi:Amt family ammonium transporter
MEINAADTGWLLVSSCLVLLMTPGLALFYGGMVSSKNVLSTFMHSFIAMGLISVVWALVGYSLAFGTDLGGGFLGGMNFALLRGVGSAANNPWGLPIPHVIFMGFQMMFAIITPALISGAFAERIKFSTYCVFIVLWSLLVYSPVAHWVWHPEGWLLKRGSLDFAGGTVVHFTSGISALVFAIMIGKRKRPGPPHNLTMTLLGAGILWFGWFGFNAGSALSSGGLAAVALINTHLAAAAAMLSWLLVEKLKHGKATALGAASGLVAGLVVITPCAGFVSPLSAIGIGLLGGAICFGGVMLKGKLGYDDSLDAFGVHGVGGFTGGILLGLFAQKAYNSAGQDGVFFGGGTTLLVENAIGLIAAGLWAVIITAILVKILDVTMGLRTDEEMESEGLDQGIHGESGYSLGRGAGGHMEAAEPAE